jgi:hypothetical protein
MPSPSNQSNLFVHRPDGVQYRLGSNIKFYCFYRKRCQYGTLRPHFADGGDVLCIWVLAANTLSKQSRTAVKGWSFSLGQGKEPTTRHNQMLQRPSNADRSFRTTSAIEYRRDVHVGIWMETRRDRGHVECLGLDGRITLKGVFKGNKLESMHWTYVARVGGTSGGVL